MALTIDRATTIVNVLQADLNSLGGGVFELDLDAFRKDLGALAATEEGIVFDDAHEHTTIKTIAGTVLARVVEITNSYQVEFEDLQYAVNLIGANSNVSDAGILVVNQVSTRAFNTAGLIQGGSLGDVEALILASAHD